LEICYKRNLNQSYMFITSDPAYSGYQIHMCRQNHIHNLLQFEPVVSEGETQFRYEITGKRSLDLSVLHLLHLSCSFLLYLPIVLVTCYLLTAETCH
jgi:hypothetical protein